MFTTKKSEDSIRRLMEQARRGSPLAIGDFLEEFRPYLLLVAFGELGSDLQVKESPSDLVQKSFMEATASFADFRGDNLEALQAWLRRILINNVQDVRVRYQAEKRDISREISRVDDVARILPSDATPPGDALIRQEQHSHVQMAFKKISPESQRLVLMRNREGISFSEIAEKLRITEQAARKRWARAIEELRELTQEASSKLRKARERVDESQI